MILAASIPKSKGGTFLQMKLVYNQLAPIFLFLLQWIDCSSSCLLVSYLNLFDIVVYKVRSDGRANISSYGRKATTSQFSTFTSEVILPSLQRLHGDSLDVDITQEEDLEMVVKKRYEDKIKLSDVDLDREKECGICLEPCTKMVLPNCCHAMFYFAHFVNCLGCDFR
ncbi:E3 ubiquitin-protein ligase AIRP2 [Rosa chinensis]|uniref:E3 ubiquitin-protein ligase AIRP2 n=1 Tax=Rosa chinensis TaxID=74649 RepID=UPI001AD90B31|nr:E3 ubiquitin-protein ligase AIRP2 [Rosa chinensis]